MNTIRKLLFCPLAAALFASTGASAASIAGDAFEASMVIEGIAVGPFSGVAGGIADGIRDGGADIRESSEVNGVEYDIAVNWVDEDSFDLLINAFGAVDLFDTSFTLSGLGFKSTGLPRDIIGVNFNRAASDVDTFDAGPRMPDPFVSFTSSSVTGTFAEFPNELAADGPILRFDVQTAVPEPATLALLIAGFGVLGLVRRLRTSRARVPPGRKRRVLRLGQTAWFIELIGRNASASRAVDSEQHPQQPDADERKGSRLWHWSEQKRALFSIDQCSSLRSCMPSASVHRKTNAA